MKKIINGLGSIVDEMCEGIVGAHDNLSLIPSYRIIRRKEINQENVALISGGGSGHEPAHAGFVGEGMLSAAVCGDVFASPSTIQVYNAIISTQTKKGTLLIVKNYSGDCMNFDAAAEMAGEDGVKVERVYVNDDVAVQDSLYTVGRRGVAGTVYVHKIAGAAAEAGMELSEVKRIAQKTIDNVKSIGLALTSCTVPAKGTPTFTLAENEIEFGVGIHGEPGIERQPLKTANELAEQMIEKLMSEFKNTKDAEFAVLINGLGATPLMELYLFSNSVSNVLSHKNINIYNRLVGNFMTSLDMAGISITMLKLDKELKGLLDSPANTAALKL